MLPFIQHSLNRSGILREISYFLQDVRLITGLELEEQER
jgi:hypothetical protein